MRSVVFAVAVFVSSLSINAAVTPREVTIESLSDGLEAAPERIYLLEQKESGVTCRLASTAERIALSPRGEPLHVIYPSPRAPRTNGGAFTITLRSTAQLDGFPDAKAAFIRAAQIWEGHITNPLNVTIDVDFGPTRFGTPYPSPNILGSTGAAQFFVNYPVARSALQARADTPAETSLYALLPGTTTVPTDLGAATRVLGASIQLLTMGFTLPADRTFPSVGFNSAFAFDLDPSNGIDNDKFDFEAVTVHEIGHALGFGSFVGSTELDPPLTEVSPTIWDLFRFRPGVTTGTFQAAQRPMSSGGSHIHFTGTGSLAMSTGRPDGTGGDEQQSSHWKDNTGGNPFIGLMDPTIPDSTHITLSQNDLNAFALMGYTIGASSPSAPAAPSNLSATGISTSAIRLNWTDNSNNETGFVVSQKVGANFVDLAPVLAANTTQADVPGFSAAQSVTFRVRARNAAGDSANSNEVTGTTTSPPGSCTPNATTVCLLNNRFRVSIDYINPFSNPPNQPGTFLAARLLSGVQNPDTGLFGFSSAQAVEVVVRVQDTRPFAPRFDVYYGGMTDVGYTVTVTDTQTGTTRQYANQVGKVGGGADRTSFPASALASPDRLITSGGTDSFPAEMEAELAGDLVGIGYAAMSAPRIAKEIRPSAAAVQVEQFNAKLLNRLSTNAGGGGGCAEAEPNETLLLADGLTLGEPCSGNANFGDSFNITVNYGESVPAGRVHDVFEVTTAAAGPITATLTFTTASADLDVVGFRDTGSGLAGIGNSSNSGVTTETFTTDPLPAGTYYIGVSAYEGGSNYTLTVTGPGPSGVCTPNSTTVCLLSNRFRVKIDYVNPFSNPPNQPGTFLAARLNSQAGINPDVALFGFSSAQAVEVVVRVQDTRPFAPRFDVYYGGMTDVGYTVTVTDTQTGTTRQYTNSVGTVGGGVDRNSFPAN